MINLFSKPIVYSTTNRITYTIADPYLSQLFRVDNFGVFRITAYTLYFNQTVNSNGTFTIPINMVDSYGNFDKITVLLQLSLIESFNSCPRISSHARCSFVFNDFFDKGM